MVVLNPSVHQTGATTRCGESTWIADSEYTMLQALAGLVSAVVRQVECELVGGHDDDHLGFVAAVDDGAGWWWIRWCGKRREVVRLEVCEYSHAKSLDDCMLPVGHIGPHSFEW